MKTRDTDSSDEFSSPVKETMRLKLNGEEVEIPPQRQWVTYASGYSQGAVEHGVTEIRFESWKSFSVFINDTFIEYSSYIYRGQANPDWLLEPTLDRLLKQLPDDQDQEQVIFRHLGSFMKAARGRRGSNPPRIETEDDWWALGQHHGLATPLLDWTNSPYVAAFFAFDLVSATPFENVAIFALHVPNIRSKTDELRKDYEPETGLRPPGIHFISPFSDENPRLINQGGLFTRTPFKVGLETWVRENFKDDNSNAKLIKMLIPYKDRAVALKGLNRMNINHLSLFPDLIGASRFCNLNLELDKYQLA